MVEQFLNRADVRKRAVSQNELDRRWKAIRERMAARGVDYLLVQSQQRYVGGYFRYFTDIPGANYPISCVFPLQEEMTIIGHGPGAPAPAANPPDAVLRGVMKKLNTPAFPNVWWEDSWDADQAVAVMQPTKPKTVGFVGMGNMSVAFADHVRKGLPGVNFINATDLVDEVRMVKSEEELMLHREAAYMHEMTYELAKEAIQPGRTIAEVLTELRCDQLSAGSEEQQLSIQFGHPGRPLHHPQHSLGSIYYHRAFKEGDMVNMLCESSMAGGYWYDLRRFMSIGPVPETYLEAHAVAKEARRIMAENCKPGLLPKVALEACDEYLKSQGCPAEMRVCGHGQGLDLVERPVFLREETCKLEVGMIVCLHPTAKTKHAAVCLSDTYVVVESGAVPLYRNLFEDDAIAVIG